MVRLAMILSFSVGWQERKAVNELRHDKAQHQCRDQVLGDKHIKRQNQRNESGVRGEASVSTTRTSRRALGVHSAERQEFNNVEVAPSCNLLMIKWTSKTQRSSKCACGLSLSAQPRLYQSTIRWISRQNGSDMPARYSKIPFNSDKLSICNETKQCALVAGICILVSHKRLAPPLKPPSLLETKNCHIAFPMTIRPLLRS